ncbi:hypothetical protein FACS1894166_08390 [Bacilli bacterium]|nr:hypothetical protein FACS1894166_08390 [Bacilli bacterium]
MLPPEEITTVSKIFDDVEMFSNLIGSMSLLLGSTLKLVDEKNMNPHKFFDKTKDLKELRKKAELVKQSEQTMLKVKTKQKTK